MRAIQIGFTVGARLLLVVAALLTTSCTVEVCHSSLLTGPTTTCTQTKVP